MSDSASPIDELLEGLRAALAARRRDGVVRIERVEAALGSYRRALEQQIATEFAAEHRLKAPAKVGVSVARAAEELRDAVLGLPEVARLLSSATAGLLDVSGAESSGPTTLRAPQSAKSAAAAAASIVVEAAATWPRLRAALVSQKLVVIGALSRDRSESAPAGLAEHIEWIDTERDGVHALGNLPQRIRQGRVAGVIILDRAVKHKHSEPALAAARDAKVPTAFAGQGGRASLERALTTLEGMLTHLTARQRTQIFSQEDRKIGRRELVAPIRMRSGVAISRFVTEYCGGTQATKQRGAPLSTLLALPIFRSSCEKSGSENLEPTGLAQCRRRSFWLQWVAVGGNGGSLGSRRLTFRPRCRHD